MKISEAKELFRQWTAHYFEGYEVKIANQSRTAKPTVPLVTIAFGNVKRPQAPNYELEDGELNGHYLSRLNIVVDLFTNGKPITDEGGSMVVYENTAMDELLSFCDFLNGLVTVNWCESNDLAILIDTEAQDLTDIVNDNNYQYRARQELSLYYTQDTDTRITDNVGYFTDVSITEEP